MCMHVKHRISKESEQNDCKNPFPAFGRWLHLWKVLENSHWICHIIVISPVTSFGKKGTDKGYCLTLTVQECYWNNIQRRQWYQYKDGVEYFPATQTVATHVDGALSSTYVPSQVPPMFQWKERSRLMVFCESVASSLWTRLCLFASWSCRWKQCLVALFNDMIANSVSMVWLSPCIISEAGHYTHLYLPISSKASDEGWYLLLIIHF